MSEKTNNDKGAKLSLVPATTDGFIMADVDADSGLVLNYRDRIKDAYKKARAAYDFTALERVCGMQIEDFHVYGNRHDKDNKDFFFYRDGDEGTNVLAVGHLDSVQKARWCERVTTPDDDLIYSPVLDDRLGVYIICELLPKLGINIPILLTTNEEVGASTARSFDIKADHQFNWMVEFDRTGTDVVTYCYGGKNTVLDNMLAAYGFHDVNRGSFSDISYLEHLKCKGFNVGVGYQDYHAIKSHAYISDTLYGVAKFMLIYEDYKDVVMKHTPSANPYKGRSSYGSSAYNGGYSGGYRGWQNNQDSYYNCTEQLSKKCIKAIKALLKEKAYEIEFPKDFQWRHHLPNAYSTLGYRMSELYRAQKPGQPVLPYVIQREITDMAENEWKENRKKKSTTSQSGSQVVGGEDAEGQGSLLSNSNFEGDYSGYGSDYDDYGSNVNGYGRPVADDPWSQAQKWLKGPNAAVDSRESLLAELGGDIDTILAKMKEVLEKWQPHWESHPPEEDHEDAKTYLDCQFFLHDNGFEDMSEMIDFINDLKKQEVAL